MLYGISEEVFCCTVFSFGLFREVQHSLVRQPSNYFFAYLAFIVFVDLVHVTVVAALLNSTTTGGIEKLHY